MRFRQQLRQNQSRSGLLALLFCLGLPFCGLAYTAAIYLILYGAFGLLFPQSLPHLYSIAVAFGLLVTAITLLNYVDALLSLREQSASERAKMLQADPLRRPQRMLNAEQFLSIPRLENILQELALLMNMPAPPAFVLWRDHSINAGIIGGAGNTAAFLITAGALNQLRREELSALVAHSYAHVYHGDLANHAHLAAVVYALDSIAEWRHGGRISLSVARERMFHFSLIGSRDGGANLLGLVLGGVGFVFSLYGRLLQSAFSRSRKHLADARAVQFTRNSHALLQLLRQALQLQQEGITAKAPSAEWGHIMFLNHGSFRLLASHPPLEERIARLGGRA